MIPVARILAEFQTMADENWTYVWGGASKGKVDCSGAFCYVYKLFGQKIDHGSNSIARKFIVKLLPISEAKPGMAAFKCKPWTNSETDKNNKWHGSEPGNVSHMGLVGQNGKTVLHAKGVNHGFVETPLDSSWQYVAYLNDVDYSEVKLNMFGNATVTTAKTELIVRVNPNTKAKKVDEAQKGERLIVIEQDTATGWYKVETERGIVGYASNRYVTLDAVIDTNPDQVQTPAVSNGRMVVEDESGNKFYPVGQIIVSFTTENID